MNITYCDRYVQIELLKGTRLLDKALEYAQKHFSKHYRLSSSVLILDDGERFKKDYLINWAYHATLQSEHSTKLLPRQPLQKVDSSSQSEPEPSEPTELEQILSHSHLPIRIKITSPNDMLKRVKIHIHLASLDQVLLRLEEDDRVARRYIRTLFSGKIIYEVENEFCINAAGYSESMWQSVIELISSRVIHNVALEFEYQKPEEGEGFLTREEYLLRKCYSELDVGFDESLEAVKKQYLKLAKIFHPDNALDKDPHTQEYYQDRFKKISHAYKTIKNAKIHKRATA